MSNQSVPDTVKLVFTPSGKRGEFPVGTSVLNAARTLGVDIDSVCGGRGICGRCQVDCVEGSFSKHQITSSTASLSPFCDAEERFKSRGRPFPRGRRLSCHCTALADAVIDVPAQSQVHHQVIRKDAQHADITMNSTFHLHYVEVEEASLDDPRGDLQRLTAALADQWQLDGLMCDFYLLPQLQEVLRKGKWAVTVAVHNGQQITAIWPGFKESIFGVAVDIGSTTVAAHLCDLGSGDVLASVSQMNPQIRFGEDLMSRVSYAMMHPEGIVEMTEAIRAALNNLFAKASLEINASTSDIMEVVVVGNPIMHHLFLGLSPLELGGAPFALTTGEAINTRAQELGLQINIGAKFYALPCIAGHVGGDTAGAILAQRPDNNDLMTLLVDIGTNAEIVLGNKERLIACSSPTGPAFEGAQISCGQRAAPGAIEQVRIDPLTLEPRYKVIGSDLWSDQEGFADSVSATGITGICGSGIIDVMAEMFLAGIISEDGVVNGLLQAKTERVISEQRTWSYQLLAAAQLPDDRRQPEISITQNDVRQIQLAKGALYAGVKLLMDKMGCSRLDRIQLAGAFGSHIDVTRAMVIGLIPDCEIEQVSSVGNAAGTGARIALLDQSSRTTIENIVKNIEKIETAVEPKFQDYFVAAMAFPNSVDSFEQLSKHVNLPEKTEPAECPSKSRRGRGRRARTQLM